MFYIFFLNCVSLKLCNFKLRVCVYISRIKSPKSWNVTYSLKLMVPYLVNLYVVVIMGLDAVDTYEQGKWKFENLYVRNKINGWNILMWMLYFNTVSTYEFDISINLLKPIGYLMHQQVKRSQIVHSAHTVFVCFVFISEQNKQRLLPYIT